MSCGRLLHGVNDDEAPRSSKEAAFIASKDVRLALEAGFSLGEIGYMLDLSKTEAARLGTRVSSGLGGPAPGDGPPDPAPRRNMEPESGESH